MNITTQQQLIDVERILFFQRKAPGHVSNHIKSKHAQRSPPV